LLDRRFTRRSQRHFRSTPGNELSAVIEQKIVHHRQHPTSLRLFGLRPVFWQKGCAAVAGRRRRRARSAIKKMMENEHASAQYEAFV